MELRPVAAGTVRALLEASDLPTDDLDDPAVALAPSHRSCGVGGLLCACVVELATGRPLWLLTTTAGDYSIRATAQFASLCPSTAVVMCRAT
jgi:hypothetical protein